MATQTSMLHIRVDDQMKAQATETLAAMGLSVSDAVRLFLHRVVVDQAMPLELKVPNAETRAAIEESRAMMTARRARFVTPDALLNDLEKNSRK
ncbi:type II toxin-antitoxin system RelB/DinJ family antitoxin [Chitinimonas sp. PSY-7]|uniref:type II toxin-antitoxin system RelB/DinJ family antitoxin n=1 Tax=Chitinimonas sp. PSY-7 TaxID=3459088 RepID=UPI004040382B